MRWYVIITFANPVVQNLDVGLQASEETFFVGVEFFVVDVL